MTHYPLSVKHGLQNAIHVFIHFYTSRSYKIIYINIQIAEMFTPKILGF